MELNCQLHLLVKCLIVNSQLHCIFTFVNINNYVKESEKTVFITDAEPQIYSNFLY